jgi:membrane protein
MARMKNTTRRSLRAFVAENPWSRLTRAAARKFYGDALTVRTAALSYWTLLSIVPLLAITFSVLKAFGVDNFTQAFLVQALEPLGSGRTEVAMRLVGFVRNAQAGVLGAAGVAGLLYTVVSLIGNVEEALNQIWRAQPIRAWTRRYGEYLGLLLVGPVLLLAASALIASAESHWLFQRLSETQLFGAATAAFTRVLPFFFLWAGFTFLYKIMPSADVHLRSAVFGAAVAAILWHLAGIAFTALVANSVNYTALYSGFAIVVVFFIWLNLAWLIVLLGSMVAYLHQHMKLYLYGEPVENADCAVQEWLALSLLREIARRFLGGQTQLTESELSDRLHVPLAQVERIIDKCVARGFLLRAVTPPGIALASAPETIGAAEILEMVRGDLSLPHHGGDDIARLLRRRDGALHVGLEGVTLRSLCEEGLEDLRGAEFPAELRKDH